MKNKWDTIKINSMPIARYRWVYWSSSCNNREWISSYHYCNPTCKYWYYLDIYEQWSWFYLLTFKVFCNDPQHRYWPRLKIYLYNRKQYVPLWFDKIESVLENISIATSFQSSLWILFPKLWPLRSIVFDPPFKRSK